MSLQMCGYLNDRSTVLYLMRYYRERDETPEVGGAC